MAFHSRKFSDLESMTDMGNRSLCVSAPHIQKYSLESRLHMRKTEPYPPEVISMCELPYDVRDKY